MVVFTSNIQEKYGEMEPFDVVRNLKLLKELKAIQEIYKQQFERYGVRHLRLEHK